MMPGAVIPEDTSRGGADEREFSVCHEFPPHRLDRSEVTGTQRPARENTRSGPENRFAVYL